MSESDCRSVRQHLVDALAADFVGPFAPGADEEVLPLSPSRWYLTGFLAPQMHREPEEAEPADDGAFEEAPETGVNDDGEQEPEPRARVTRWPASIGMTLLVPAAARELRVSVTWADYYREDPPAEPADKEGRRRRATNRVTWRRVNAPSTHLAVPVDTDALREGIDVPNSRGLKLIGQVRAAEVPNVPSGTLSLSLFLVNARAPVTERGRADEAYAFGVGFEVDCAAGLIPRPDLAGGSAREWDDMVAALQYRHHREYAVGHGVSVEVPGDGSPPTRARTTWLPSATVPRVKPNDVPGVEVGMDALARLDSPKAVGAALGGLVDSYDRWLEGQEQIALDDDNHIETRKALMKKARTARTRIANGISALTEDPELRRAFCIANEAMARQSRKRLGIERPTWRLFQLAFVLLNLPGLANPLHDDRKTVELIFFPTGGGKTEAYLGVIACALVLRRLRRRGLPDQGLGVAVMLRYTLRLLTLDQLGRAATLICALELLRRERPEDLGEERFSLGLWVGRSATANTFKQVRPALLEYRQNASPRAESPCPLPVCPWCSTEFEKTSFDVEGGAKGHAEEVTVRCPNWECEFTAGVPVLFVDEQIYRELPSFLIATVDKFAMLPWRGETGALFGRVSHRLDRWFYGAMDKRPPKGAIKLPDGLLPPELIVQDELHLISGPLGTMVGLYETAIDALCTRTDGDETIRPKILASTATVKRAREQIQALYTRKTELFPPPGVDAWETFFASVDHTAPGRMYVGVAAPGRAMKALLIRTYVSLLTAAAAKYNKGGEPRQPADPYMTLVGYFNSLRELGGMRRLVESEVHQSSHEWHRRVPVGHAGENPWFGERGMGAPVELTSRESTFDVANTKHDLARHATDDKAVDVALASNMISVGVDIERLGLMVVGGQPKTTSEYIQATSRVGRDKDRPGLVVTAFNLHKARDRSHYEHFSAYHESFYRYVEATSVTPFAGPALERGMAGTLVAMTRFGDPSLTPAEGFMALEHHRGAGNAAVLALAERARQVTSSDEAYDKMVERGHRFLDTWERIAAKGVEHGGVRSYSRFDDDRAKKTPVLSMAVDATRPPPDSEEARFVCPTSMRDVESSVHLWLVR